MHDNLVHARPNHGGLYAVKLDGLGIFMTAGLDDDGQPYVSVNTEEMAPEHTYDNATGLRGTDAPYDVEQDGEDAVVIFKPTGETVARHYPSPTEPTARLAARDHALMLNNDWPDTCGAPMISVHLNDAELYDARDHNPALRETEEKKTNA